MVDENEGSSSTSTNGGGEDERRETTSQRDAAEAVWFAKEELAFAAVSVFAMLAIAFGLMVASGLINVPAPVSTAGAMLAGLLVILVGGLATVLLWTRWGPPSTIE